MVKFTMSSINEQQNPPRGGGGVEREKEGRKGKLFSCCREGEVKKVAAFLALSPRREAQTFLSDIQQIQAGGGGKSLPPFGVEEKKPIRQIIKGSLLRRK